MADFKKNISQVEPIKKAKYFQLPKDFDNLVDKKNKKDTSLDGIKRRLDKQLEDRKNYIDLLTDHLEALKYYEKNPTSDKLKKEVEMTKVRIDRHNLEIEITAQKNVFIDTYIYYKEDFMKRYEKGIKEKDSVFK